MPTQLLQLNSNSIALDGAVADQLIRLGSGDAALLMLYLLRCRGEYDPIAAGKKLRWTRAQLDTALAQLQELKLISGALLPSSIELAPTPDDAPTYTIDDMTAEMTDKNSQFAPLLREVERVLGRRLSNPQVLILLELYDHVGLPSEVLLTMINWLNSYNIKKHGPGKKLSMTYVRRIGYQWKEHGYDTLEAVDEYIKNQEFRETKEGEILAMMGIYGRAPVAEESKNINKWLDWGFPLETIRIAYEITLTKTGNMSWGYCTGILRRWKEKGLITPQQVASESKPEQPAGQPAPPAQRNGFQRSANGGYHLSPRDVEDQKRDNRQNLLEMQRYLAQMETSE